MRRRVRAGQSSVLPNLVDYPDMGLEIERKFLVSNEGWKAAVIRSVRIRDGLIANNKGHKARVRIANDVATIAR